MTDRELLERAAYAEMNTGSVDPWITFWLGWQARVIESASAKAAGKEGSA